MSSNSIESIKLKRTLGFSQLLAVGAGLVVSQGVMVLMLQGAGFGGFSFFTTMGLAYLLALFYVFSFAELSLLFKSPGTVSTYTEAAIGNFPAIMAVFAYLVVAMFALSAELVLIELMLLEVMGISLPPMLLAFLCLRVLPCEYPRRRYRNHAIGSVLYHDCGNLDHGPFGNLRCCRAPA